MNQTNKDKLKLVPKKPGVYIMKNIDLRVIYVGKAKALHNRLSQYFIGKPKDQKTMQMVMNVHDFDYIITNSEKDALILEANLIKKYKPKYNILLKDDKSYPFIKLETKNKYPYLKLVRRTQKDSSKYYGPFLNAYLVNEIIDLVSKEFKLRSCTNDLEKPKKRECINYHIGYCSAPCTRKITDDEYNNNIKLSLTALDSGLKSLIPKLTEKMINYSEKQEFEYAAEMRDKINLVNKFSEKQQVVTTKRVNLDAVSIYRDGDLTAVSVIEVKNGIINDKKAYTFSESDQIGSSEIISSFLEQYYVIKEKIVTRIILCYNGETEIDYPELSKNLSEMQNKEIKVSKGRGKFSKNILKMAEVNAIEAIKLRRETKIDDILFRLKEKLKLYQTPMRIESYDISNTAGSNPVGVMTVFENGILVQKEKRMFSIKGINGSDDYASIYEVLDRRFSNLVEGQDKPNGFESTPDLIFIDGGKGQVKMARQAMEKHSLSLPVFGLVKDQKHRTRDITDGYMEFNVKEDRDVYTFVSKIQEETHKNAITYHKKKSTLTATQSDLLEIPNVGKATLKKLYNEFKTVAKMKASTVSELSAVVPKKTAENIYAYFNKKS